MPGLGQQHHAGGGQDRPEYSALARTEKGDSQRTEELQGTRGAERDAGDREHEEQHQAGRHHAKHATGPEILASEFPQARADENQEEEAGPDEPQGGHAHGAELTEQVNRQGQCQLDTGHGGDRHKGAPLGALETVSYGLETIFGRAHDALSKALILHRCPLG